LFQRADNVEAGWQAAQPILDSWAEHPPRDFPNYVAGSTGPDAADELLARDGRAWRPLDDRS
jgi:glucose-6-phosphate 1-dehydrogenase